MKVSVITPTANRPEMLRRCIEMFLKQDWEDKELIIVHEFGQLPVIPLEHTTHYGNNRSLTREIGLNVYTYDNSTIGYKRNSGCSYAKGEIIIHMDDDDIYAPDYITCSVNTLINTKADLVGLNKFYFYNQANSRAYEYHYQGGQKAISGATMCYWRSLWDRNKFPDISQGEDAVFCSTVLKIAYGDYQDSFIAIRHGANTSPVNFNGKEFSEIPTLPQQITNLLLTK